MDEVIDDLKDELNLLRLKWEEMNLSFNPKFHLLYEHTITYLKYLNGFFDLGKDAIERWHQLRMRHFDRIR